MNSADWIGLACLAGVIAILGVAWWSARYRNGMRFDPWPDDHALPWLRRPFLCKVGMHAWGQLSCPLCGAMDEILSDAFQEEMIKRLQSSEVEREAAASTAAAGDRAARSPERP